MSNSIFKYGLAVPRKDIHFVVSFWTSIFLQKRFSLNPRNPPGMHRRKWKKMTCPFIFATDKRSSFTVQPYAWQTVKALFHHSRQVFFSNYGINKESFPSTYCNIQMICFSISQKDIWMACKISFKCGILWSQNNLHFIKRKLLFMSVNDGSRTRPV